ncbi:hypothetical protein K7A41_19920 [Sphingobacterium sp. InxBP1]|uniref:hypothetical protein n=1 Tax=Sphingobacterium sp. InxBP1 TaxID=2870328 RepID=UPI0022447C4B|nr:hypothetical protein [Sphingobacterium sp. InxBP1]MCW8313505.1 hypothetical protein [Sphingobacterium sp. InxBP1]
MVLTLVELIEKGIVLDNRFEVGVDLVGLFQENWRLLVRTAHQSDFTLQSYYLQSDKVLDECLWKLYLNSGYQINAHFRRVQTLSEVVAYGSFNVKLVVFFSDAINRAFAGDYLYLFF